MRNILPNVTMVALAACMVAACGGGTPGASESAGNAAANDIDANAAAPLNYQAEVLKLDPPARDGVFLRAVRDAKLPCQDVTASERLDPVDGNPTWRATCDGRTPHIISITADGTAKIVSRADR
ncbi:hypothetical protein [Sphingomonas sp.]|uniref:hypothetical protein n=1 Tax=Sphingomonas sp. TaxID=28214 RepID=UPI001EB5DCD1|nr:hypothetical protein [Sphingomonas sp.]MBX3594185.1 hypothetical protein [Sphingomonas sp.]